VSLFPDGNSACCRAHTTRCSSNLSPTERLKEQGDDKYKAGMFEEAIDLYTQCIDRVGDMRDGLVVKALSNRAACFKQLSNFDATIADCTAVLDVGVTALAPLLSCHSVVQVEPDNVKALVRRAQAFEAVERYKLALQVSTRLLVMLLAFDQHLPVGAARRT
jgi:stress-induced-phosphoprotein 1